MAKRKKKYPVILVLSERGYNNIKELKDLIGAKSYEDVINNALEMYEEFVKSNNKTCTGCTKCNCDSK